MLHLAPGTRTLRFISIASIVGLLILWHTRVTGQLSWVAIVSFVLFVFVSLAYGSAFLYATANLVKNTHGLTFQFLCGFILFNTLLFVLSLVSPLGMLINVSILSVIALGLSALPLRRSTTSDKWLDELPGLLCIIVSGLAATFWCSDAQTPLLIRGETAVYQNWQDIFPCSGNKCICTIERHGHHSQHKHVRNACADLPFCKLYFGSCNFSFDSHTSN